MGVRWYLNHQILNIPEGYAVGLRQHFSDESTLLFAEIQGCRPAAFQADMERLGCQGN